jgi:hypothetical protein
MAVNIADALSKLQNLRGVTGRKKVLPGAQFAQEMENPPVDLSGTYLPPPGVGEMNLPEADLGGELTSQSYDVRANTVGALDMTEEQIPQEEENLFTRFGRALAMQTHNTPNPQSAPIETKEVEAQEGILPAQEQQYPNTALWENLGNALSEYTKPMGTESWLYGTGDSENRKLIERAQLKTQGIDPDQYAAQQQESHAAEQAKFQADMDKAQQNPMEHIVYGATDRAAKMPEIKTEVKKITGIDFTDQIAEMTSKYEKILSDQENLNNEEMVGYDDQMKRINQRILENQATDADKLYIGLALLMPVLVGAMFGKEAAIGALAGGAKGIGDVYGNRIKNAREDEELLANINKLKGQNELKKSELELEKLKIPKLIQDSLPKDEKEYLVGKNEVKWTDPKTGEEQVGIEIKPGLVARPEFVSNKEELKEMRKEAGDIGEAMTATQDINKLTKDIIFLSSKLKDKNLVGQAMTSYLNGKDPGLAAKFGEEIEFEGRKVNSMIALEHKLKLLVDAYRQAKGMKALTNTVQEHIDGLFRNPSTSFQSYRDTIDQMLYTRDLAQKRLLNTVTSAGFVPEFLMEQFGKENKGVYDQLNNKEGEKLSSQLLRE